MALAAAASLQTAVGPGLVWSGGGALVLGTGQVLGAVLWDLGPASQPAGTLVEVVLRLPRDARVEQAVFELGADAVENAALASFAQVSAATPTGKHRAAARVDLGAFVVVGGVLMHGPGHALRAGGLDVDSVSRWTGTEWQDLSAGTSFPDTATQRLLLQTGSSRTSDDYAAEVREHVGVRLPAVPTGLELLVAGRTVWFERQGSSVVPGRTAPVPDTGATYLVDRTEAVRAALAEAVAAAPPDADEVGVPVALRATTPGALSLVPAVSALRVHAVTFVPEGRARSVELLEEGAVEVDVRPPQASAVHEVALSLRGRFGPERVVPPVGPPTDAPARLVLAAGRTVLVGLPRLLTARLARLSGVRLLLQLPAGSSGGQVTGRLLAVAPDGGPGEPLPDGGLTVLDVRSPDPAWRTLGPPEPVPLPPGGEGEVGAWLELQPTSGSSSAG